MCQTISCYVSLGGIHIYILYIYIYYIYIYIYILYICYSQTELKHSGLKIFWVITSAKLF